MTFQFRTLADQAQADGQITADEILALRREGWGDGRIEPAEAEALFVLNDHLAERTLEWTDFFVEALGEYILSGGSPRGFVGEDQAEWLIERLDRSGQVETMAELELLAHLFERAERVPERLRDYALAQVEQIVLTGQGPTRDGGQIDAARITPAECRLLSRIIYSFVSEAPGGVSRAEAEMLFRLKDATLGADNAPEWPDLFVKAVANHLMAHNRFAQLSAERALELERFMGDANPRIGAFFGRMARSDIGGSFAEAASRVLGFGRKGTERDLASEVAGDHKVTELEDAWLQRQVDANRQLDALDKALLRFIVVEQARGA
ncbi:hypothetical protein H7F51_03550 [Novosphingobium flavum]|uniref:Uncharacterized protein n=1 Tax=Novosphingobium flavum TaxID=1778672 RepID=A0A7X1FQB8_9SPHN|nr:hypothetical protein [Novosphingobium flavum]MBC2664592.1 hypothetical protein [Novosphingobium flavum]